MLPGTLSTTYERSWTSMLQPSYALRMPSMLLTHIALSQVTETEKWQRYSWDLEERVVDAMHSSHVKEVRGTSQSSAWHALSLPRSDSRSVSVHSAISARRASPRTKSCARIGSCTSSCRRANAISAARRSPQAPPSSHSSRWRPAATCREREVKDTQSQRCSSQWHLLGAQGRSSSHGYTSGTQRRTLDVLCGGRLL